MIALAAALVDAVYFLLIALGCAGTDASSPPRPGTLEDALCGTPIWAAYTPLAVFAVVGPFVGISRARGGRRNGVAIGFAFSAGAIAALALVAHLAVGRTWDSVLFVGLPVSVFLVALLIATVPRTGGDDAGITRGTRPRP